MSLLPEYRNMLAYIDSKIDGLSMTSSDRKVIAAALFDVANDHAKGISTLFENHLYASAYALVRPLFETFIRAAWLLHCATDQEVETFKEKDKIELESKEKFYFGDMVVAVEKNLDWPATLSGVKSHFWSALNSYTHGGQFQVSRRFNGSTIEPNHDPGQIDEIVKFSAMLAFVTFCEMVQLSDHREADKYTEELSSKVSLWCFNKQSKADA